MRRSTLPKLLALFISGSILFSSVPVYAGETTSLTESVTEEASMTQTPTIPRPTMNRILLLILLSRRSHLHICTMMM